MGADLERPRARCVEFLFLILFHFSFYGRTLGGYPRRLAGWGQERHFFAWESWLNMMHIATG